MSAQLTSKSSEKSISKFRKKRTVFIDLFYVRFLVKKPVFNQFDAFIETNTSLLFQRLLGHFLGLLKSGRLRSDDNCDEMSDENYQTVESLKLNEDK